MEVRIDVGPGVPRPLLVTADQLVIDHDAFALAELTGIQWRTRWVNAHGSYVDSTSAVHLWAADRHAHWAMSPSPRDGDRFEALDAAFAEIVAVLDRLVAPRIATGLVDRIRTGETITLGPAGARIELTADGFRLKKPFSKPVPWSRVTAVDATTGRVWLLVDGERHSKVPLEGENLVVLPHLAELLRPR